MHTPGPWTAEPTVPSDGFDCWHIVAANGEDIAWAKGYQSDAEKQANARLFAAAPDLFDALREAILQIEYLHDKFQKTGSGAAVLARARAAFGKATGAK